MQSAYGQLEVPKTPELLRDYETFKMLFKRQSGLDLNSYKFDQTYRRIWGMVKHAQFKKFTEYFEYLKSDPSRVQGFMDKLAINVTELFRNPEQFEILNKTILPDLLKKSSALSIWSAGCSYGAEAYTIAMLLDQLSSGRPHRITGTDIDQEMLDRARRGYFEAPDMKEVRDFYLKRYFRPGNHAGRDVFEVVPGLKTGLQFKQHNLLADQYSVGYDLIVCRNVVIYFSDEAKDKIYRDFYRSLKPGGYLFVGSTERVANSRDIGFTTPYPFFYQKLNNDSGGNIRHA